MSSYAIGLDYGTNSCRSLLINLETGAELGSEVFPYPSGTQGILTCPDDPQVARQSPADYLAGMEQIIRGALSQAAEADSEFSPANVVGIGIDTTGSTIIPIDAQGQPLAFRDQFRDNLNAKVWLWKDHTATDEAEEITALAADRRPAYLRKCGGTYSSEWFWSKILRCLKHDPEVFDAAHTWVEHCDWLPAVLCGQENPSDWKRSICAAGHKALFHDDWGGLPDEEFLKELDPKLSALRGRLYESAQTAEKPVGTLCEAWAEKLGLPAGIAIAGGLFDAHSGAVGCAVQPGTLIKIMGTSTCDITVAEPSSAAEEVPGVCGLVPGSVLPDAIGIEAGQSAVGDLFLWFVNHLVPDSYGASLGEKFVEMERRMKDQKPGATGLLALDWNNGNRSILTDGQLSGLMLGQTLQTEAHEIYRALIEATAFGALVIIQRMEECGVPVEKVVATGGLSLKNETLMQIYSDVLNRPMQVAAGEQTCAMGAAIFGAVASGGYDVATLQQTCCRFLDKTYQPIPENVAAYEELFALYQQLHDSFGRAEAEPVSLFPAMKKLIELRDRQR